MNARDRLALKNQYSVGLRSPRLFYPVILTAVVSLGVGCGKKTANDSAAKTAASGSTAAPGEAAGSAAPAAASGPAAKAVVEQSDRAVAAARRGNATAGSAQNPAQKDQNPKASAPVQAGETATPSPTIAKEKLQSLFNQWLVAQNEGNFAAYAALYGARFTGIKRSGARKRTFKREGWLRDRKRMFGKSMTVEGNKVELAATAESAVISFEQTWASGNYKDVGPKQLVIVRTDDGLRIAREEMLRSEVTSGESKHQPLASDHFGFVWTMAGKTWVVLDSRPSSSWAKGPPTLISMTPIAVTVRAVDEQKLPKSVTMMANRELRLFGHSKQICRATVKRFAMLARVVPHFGTINYWQGEEGGKRLAKAKVAAEAWALGDGGRLLVAEVEAVKANNCAGALWAQDDRQKEPEVLGPVSMPPRLLKAGLLAFRKLKGYAEIQKSYVEMTELPRPRHWDKYETSAPKMALLSNQSGTQRYLAVSAVAGSGCGDFIGEYWAIWRVQGSADKPQLVLMTDDRAPGAYFEPRTAVDLDGDGKVEFIGTHGILQPVGPTLRQTDSVEVPDLDCPC